MILIKNIKIYAPAEQQRQDILIGGEQIVALEKDMKLSLKNLEIIDGKDLIACPGFIDSHVHILGGGGEGGFKTRTPEIQLSDMITAGVTTVVGCLGTDGITRRMESLLAKAKGLKEEGVSAYVYTGNYRVPIAPLTGDVMKDIMLIDEIIGVGEIALSDHRSSHPSLHELKKLSSNARTGGILSKKSGIVNLHLGDGKKELKQIEKIVETTEIPITQFLPTHMNRNPSLFKAGLDYAKKGGALDFTTSTTKKFLDAGEIYAPKAYKKALDAGISPTQITFTSDGQGSLPAFDSDGSFTGLDVGKCFSLYKAFRTAVKDYNIPIPLALHPITKTPATLLKLEDKGSLTVGKTADIVLMDSNLNLTHVIARGQIMLKNQKLLVTGTFE